MLAPSVPGAGRLPGEPGPLEVVWPHPSRVNRWAMRRLRRVAVARHQRKVTTPRTTWGT
jgi:hypothetical protein